MTRAARAAGTGVVLLVLAGLAYYLATNSATGQPGPAPPTTATQPEASGPPRT